MKKILLFGFMLAFIANIKGQEYVPFPMDSTIWSVNTTKYFVNGDTVIANKNYSKVWMQTDSVEFEFDMNKATYYAAIRNDTANKRVYGVYYKADTVYKYDSYIRFLFDNPNYFSPVYYNCDTCELLIYDFNVESIDSLTIYTFPFTRYDRDNFLRTTSKNMIMQIQLNDFDVSIQNIQGVDRKVVNVYSHLQCSWTGTWIEGIGSLSGLFYTGHYMELGWPGESELLCANEKEITLYQQDTTCYRPITRTLGSVNEFQKNNDFSIYPNPSINNEFWIKNNTHNNAFSEVDVELFDIYGKRVFSLSIANIQSPISINHLPKGVYVYKIINKLKQKGYGKIIVL